MRKVILATILGLVCLAGSANAGVVVRVREVQPSAVVRVREVQPLPVVTAPIVVTTPAVKTEVVRVHRYWWLRPARVVHVDRTIAIPPVTVEVK